MRLTAATPIHHRAELHALKRIRPGIMGGVSFDRIMVPLDGSPSALRAVEQARRLAGLFSADLWLVTVADPEVPDVDLDGILEEGRRAAGTVPVEVEVAFGDDPPSVVARLNDEHPRALCCLATRGRHPLARLLLGSVARAVVDRADEPVVLVGPKCTVDADVPLHRIVVALDGSDESETALAWAPGWAAATGAKLDLVRVLYPLPDPAARVAPTKEQMDDIRYVHVTARGIADDTGTVRPFNLQAADPVEALSDHLDEFAPGLVAAATRPASPAAELILGSVAAQLVRVSPAPVALTSRTDSRLRS